VSKRGLIILGVIALVGTWLFVVGYEFLEKENALWQQKVKAAREDQRKCEARLSKFRNFDQFRTSIRLPYTSDLSPERWTQKFDTLRAGMSEAEVEIIMGAPDYVRCVVSEKGDAFMGSYWQYEIAIARDPANDAENSFIVATFGPDGKLQDKKALNMPPKPSPTPSAVQTTTPAETGSPAPSATPTPAAVSAATPTPVATPVPSQATPSNAATPSPTPQ
jgi:hypothetical protein